MGDPRDNPGLWRPEYSKAFAALRFGGEDREEAARLLDAVEAAARAATLRAAAGQAPAPQCPACGHGQAATRPCTCARCGAHSRNCLRYVPGHDLASPTLALARYRAETNPATHPPRPTQTPETDRD